MRAINHNGVKRRSIFGNNSPHENMLDDKWLHRILKQSESDIFQHHNDNSHQLNAVHLARSHKSTTAIVKKDLLKTKFEDNVGIIEDAYDFLSMDFDQDGTVQQASILLVENISLIHSEIRAARHYLHGKHHHKLPHLTSGKSEGMPRVYEVAINFITHLTGPFTEKKLHRYLEAYQSVTPLTAVELWALMDMLRLALIEYFSDMSVGIVRHYSFRAPKNTRLDIIATDHNVKANDLQAMQNVFLSLKELSIIDSVRFVEKASPVERILRGDPAGIYQHMSSDSRTHYRYIVATIAKRSLCSEEEVAQIAVKLANEGYLNNSVKERRLSTGDKKSEHQTTASDMHNGIHVHNLQSHVGYYLLDQGRQLLEECVLYQPDWKQRAVRLFSKAPFGYYTGVILAVFLLIIIATQICLYALGVKLVINKYALLILFLLYACIALHFTIHLVNWFCTLIVKPRKMMRLDFSRGIPSEYRTIVAVPTLLTSENNISDLIRQLEVRYLANKDGNLLFALLTDFPDAEQECMPDDDKLLALVCKNITRLNKKYRKAGGKQFYLLHRPRKWNSIEKAWMGHERKRGKLAALNQLIVTGNYDEFSTTVGNLSQLRTVRYVITLDTDTRLPGDVAKELAGCMAHPLNKARIDPSTNSVIGGYAILQPSVGATISEANRSAYSRLLAGDVGLAPYTRHSSNLYFDLFSQSSYMGKGIYDVRAFKTVFENRFPDNRILSHDLIEGCFASCGYVNDVEVYEGLPSHFLADMYRRHRWIRGDWQIASWLWQNVPSPTGKIKNCLSALSRWKIFDNLRQSLTPTFQISFLLLSWLVAGEAVWFMTLLGVIMISGTSLVNYSAGLLIKPSDIYLTRHIIGQVRLLKKVLFTEIVYWSCLPFTAYCYTDATVRANYRLYVSSNKLLEWITASETEQRCMRTWLDHYILMWPCTVVSIVLALLLASVDKATLFLVSPILLTWIFGPFVAWLTSLPSKKDRINLSETDSLHIRRWARQTWHYFEIYQNAQNNWLPPDNVQEVNCTTATNRTSPTNISMALLSNLAAYDLGYQPAKSMLDRVSHIFNTMYRLEKYKGHLFNWYNTQTLKSIEPKYVSSVDSGNLMAGLAVMQEGLKELGNRRLIHRRMMEGLRDTIEVIANLPSTATLVKSSNRLNYSLNKLRHECSGSFWGGARRACKLLDRIYIMAENLKLLVPNKNEDLIEWLNTFMQQCQAVRKDLLRIAFWVHIPIHKSGFASDSLTSRERKYLNIIKAKIEILDGHCPLKRLPKETEHIAKLINKFLQLRVDNSNEERDKALHSMLISLQKAMQHAATEASSQQRLIANLIHICRKFQKMNFGFLLNNKRKLLAVGYKVKERCLDGSCYDLLASESRLCSYLAICQGQLPLKHWFSFGRMSTLTEGKPSLISWSGSMFEYLMPLLILPSYRNTLLDASSRGAVRKQIKHARELNIPWGISESCYNLTDTQGAYQYRAFGVPGLGLEPGIKDHKVIAPYASALAISIAPRDVCNNLAQLESLGYLSSCGFYDAIDFTPGRCLPSGKPIPCRTVMAHHSGMTLLAFANALLGNIMPRRLLRNPCYEAHNPLLQEQIPIAINPIETEEIEATQHREVRLRPALPSTNNIPKEINLSGIFNSSSTAQEMLSMRSQPPQGEI